MSILNLTKVANVAFDTTYQKYWLARFLSSLCLGTLSVCVAWQIYDISRNPLHLGLVGLTQFIPLVLLVVVTGYCADNFNRKIIFSLCLFLEAFLTFLFVLINISGNPEIIVLFMILIGIGIVRAFFSPAAAAFLPNIVDKKDLPDAVALSAVAWQSGTIFGPVLGGLLYGASVFLGYFFASIGLFIGAILVFIIPYNYLTKTKKPLSFENLTGGFSYVWNKKILLGVISLDLFAVLMAGAVALMPVYARDILDTGPLTLGLLRSSPGVGAIIVAVGLSFYSIQKAGKVMLYAVAFFGLFTLFFGLSKNVTLSIILLCLVGGFDMLSVYIRDIIIQLGTEDSMRGRVNAVNMMFVGASNELGDFRAGVMASGIGAVPAVAFGGVGAIVIAGAWSYIFPDLLKINQLDKKNKSVDLK
ncbi:MAG: MFS transporter [Candidatus Puniceispirillales bacterium]